MRRAQRVRLHREPRGARLVADDAREHRHRLERADHVALHLDERDRRRAPSRRRGTRRRRASPSSPGSRGPGRACAGSGPSRCRRSRRRSIHASARSAFGISSSTSARSPSQRQVSPSSTSHSGVASIAAVVGRVRHLAGARHLAAAQLVHDLARLLLAPGDRRRAPDSARACAASRTASDGATDKSSSDVMIESRPNGAANHGMPAPRMPSGGAPSPGWMRSRSASRSSRSCRQRRVERDVAGRELRRRRQEGLVPACRAARRRSPNGTSSVSRVVAAGAAGSIELEDRRLAGRKPQLPARPAASMRAGSGCMRTTVR